MKFVVCYDISDPKDLAKISKYLEKRGIRVQYSIFEVETTYVKLKKMISDIEELMNLETDRVYAFPLEDEKYKNIERIGKLTSLNILWGEEMRKIYMVCYDICDDKRRNRIIRELLKFGIRTQYSVFECKLTEKEKNYLKREISKIINEKEDLVYFYPLSENSYKKIIRTGSNIDYLPIHDIFI